MRDFNARDSGARSNAVSARPPTKMCGFSAHLRRNKGVCWKDVRAPWGNTHIQGNFRRVRATLLQSIPFPLGNTHDELVRIQKQQEVRWQFRLQSTDMQSPHAGLTTMHDYNCMPTPLIDINRFVCGHRDRGCFFMSRDPDARFQHHFTCPYQPQSSLIHSHTQLYEQTPHAHSPPAANTHTSASTHAIPRINPNPTRTPATM